MSKPQWNGRFHITDSRDNKKVHDFFREYFDKPSKHRNERISLPSSPSKFYPNLASTLDKHSHRIPRIRKYGVRTKKSLEESWNPNFHVKISKDNQHFYGTYREYFDTQRMFDHNSSVVVTTPASAHGYKRAEKPRYNSADPRGLVWSNIYNPISENNSVKYKTLRNYFDNSKALY